MKTLILNLLVLIIINSKLHSQILFKCNSLQTTIFNQDGNKLSDTEKYGYFEITLNKTETELTITPDNNVYNLTYQDYGYIKIEGVFDFKATKNNQDFFITINFNEWYINLITTIGDSNYIYTYKISDYKNNSNN